MNVQTTLRARWDGIFRSSYLRYLYSRGSTFRTRDIFYGTQQKSEKMSQSLRNVPLLLGKESLTENNFLKASHFLSFP